MKTRNGFQIVNVYRLRVEFPVVVSDSEDSWIEQDWLGLEREEVPVHDVGNLETSIQSACKNCDSIWNVVSLSETRKLGRIAALAATDDDSDIPF
ncbi:hypothetical protein [Okeania sp. SIO2B9]|uniref:hypothetical protein n=1 Tax=Okeania sp. SIO2B9 TaxID=2607782 RepID=UPI00257D0F62|nr:hypothetical protein [Okeania sp. SIO2B9]